jgi:DNA-binding NarL/FixJ family response regulator
MNKPLDLGHIAMDQRARRRGSANYAALSPREREVMFYAAKGIANKAIARELNVAEGTVKLHLHRVYQKLGIKSRFALAALARNLPPLPSRKHRDPSDAA